MLSLTVKTNITFKLLAHRVCPGLTTGNKKMIPTKLSVRKFIIYTFWIVFNSSVFSV